jgi:hypothetical protein
MRIKYAQILIRSLDTIYKVQVIAVFANIHCIPIHTLNYPLGVQLVLG